MLLDGHLGPVTVHLDGPPLLGVIPKGDAPRSGIDPLAARQIKTHLRQKVLGVDLAPKRLSALPTGWIAVAR